MTLDQLISQWSGKGIDFDGYYGFQCMDLAHKYCVDCVGKDFAPAPAAKDVWNQNIDGYDKIENTPDGIPSKGDIMIWGTGVGAYGHIAVFVSGDTNMFTSFDQNWPLGSLCHLQNHNYTGVLGWFHPKSIITTDVIIDKATFEELVRKSTLYDGFYQANYQNIGEVQEAITQRDGEIINQREQINDLEAANEVLKQRVAELSFPTPPEPPSDPALFETKLFGYLVRIFRY